MTVGPFQMKMAKMEQMDVDGALVEVDYVSQENKDIQKRRKFLFRMVLKNDIEYIMQAPNENQRKIWYITYTNQVMQSTPCM